MRLKVINDFEVYNQKKLFYDNWVISLCDLYNSLLRYYGEQSNEKWNKVNEFISEEYEYDERKITLSEILKKYRNKKIHFENIDSIENNLLPHIITDEKLEELQLLLFDVINFEIKNLDSSQLVTHVLKNGSNTISFKKIKKALSESIKYNSSEEKEMLEDFRVTLFEFFDEILEISSISEDFFEKWEEKLKNKIAIMKSEKFRIFVSEQPGGVENIQLLNKLQETTNEYDFIKVLFEYINKLKV